MGSLDRDAGLNRVVGPVALAASMISIVVGAGIFVVPAELSQAMGSLAPLAVVACAVAIGAVGVAASRAAEEFTPLLRQPLDPVQGMSPALCSWYRMSWRAAP